MAIPHELALSITIIAAAQQMAAPPIPIWSRTAAELRSIATSFRSEDPANGAFVYGTGATATITAFTRTLAQSLASHYQQTGDITLCNDNGQCH